MSIDEPGIRNLRKILFHRHRSKEEVVSGQVRVFKKRRNIVHSVVFPDPPRPAFDPLQTRDRRGSVFFERRSPRCSLPFPHTVKMGRGEKGRPKFRNLVVMQADITGGNRPARKTAQDDPVRIDLIFLDNTRNAYLGVGHRGVLVAPPARFVLLMVLRDERQDDPDEIAPQRQGITQMRILDPPGASDRGIQIAGEFDNERMLDPVAEIGREVK